jgi:thioredoxin reductase (NADPH)
VNTTRWAVVSAGLPETVPAATVDRQCGSSALREEAGHLVVRLTDGTDVVGRAVIVATGARYRRLAASRLGKFEHSGVYTRRLTQGSANARPRRWSSSAVATPQGKRAVLRRVRQPGHRRHLPFHLSDSMSRYLVDRIIEHSRIDARSTTMTTRGSASLH